MKREKLMRCEEKLATSECDRLFETVGFGLPSRKAATLSHHIFYNWEFVVIRSFL